MKLLSERYFEKMLNDKYILTHLNVGEASKEIKRYGEYCRLEGELETSHANDDQYSWHIINDELTKMAKEDNI